MGDTNVGEIHGRPEPARHDEQPVRVLYVAGYSRSGSTILTNVLGQLEGYFGAGEIMYVWDQLLSEEASCGCRAHVSECPVWSRVLERAFGASDPAYWARMEKLRDSEWQSRKIPEWLFVGRSRRRLAHKMHDYFDALSELYAAIGQEIPEEVVVDSSKNPAYLYFLMQVQAIDLRVVHIIRDPRASAFSWRSSKEGFTSHGVLESVKSWTARNAMLALLGNRLGDRYLRVRYEDFVTDPRGTLTEISRFAGAERSGFPFLEGEGIDMGTNHFVFGNPDLFRTGPVRLKLDERWKDDMPAGERRLVTALSWPLMIRFGYPLGR